MSYMSGAGRAMADYLEAWDSVKYRKIIIERNNSIKLYDACGKRLISFDGATVGFRRIVKIAKRASI